MGLRHGPQNPDGYDGGLSGGQGFVTDTHVMVSARDYVEDVGQLMTAEVDRLMANLDSLHPGTWDGNAYQAFLTAKLAWQGAHDDIMKALRGIEAGLTDSSKRYDQADKDSELGITNAVKNLNYTL